MSSGTPMDEADRVPIFPKHTNKLHCNKLYNNTQSAPKKPKMRGNIFV